MANLPTAYASQTFGRKTLDFYVASGDVNGADPRARADERRLTDLEGAKHTVRLVDRDFDLEPGDQASVLRLQSGPARRSRPVAVVNHSREAWSRTHPGASALLSRAGVARNVNWLFTMALLAMASLVLIWPYLRTFMIELDPGLFGAAPEFNVLALALSALPDLAQWNFSDTAAPLSGLIASVWPASAEFADQIVFLSATTLGGLSVFALRSWRLLWAPLYVGVVGLVALSLGGVEGAAGHALSAFGLTGVVFLFGGLINRVRDAARLDGRIALLADHVLRHADDEGVGRSEGNDEPVADDTKPDHVSDTGAPVVVAAALSDGAGEETLETSEPDSEADQDASEDDTAETEVDDEDASEATTQTEDSLEETEADSTDLSDTEASEDEAGSETTDTVIASESEDAELAQDSASEAGEETSEAEAADVEASDVDEPADEVETEDEASAPSDEADTVQSDETDPAELSDDSGDETGTDAVIEGDAEPDETLSQDEAQAEETESAPEDEAPVTTSDEATDEADSEDEDLEIGGIDAEESERLKNDPRYAARAIVLPSPPPMPSEADAEGESGGEAEDEASGEPDAGPTDEAPAEPETTEDETAPEGEAETETADASAVETSVAQSAEPKSSETRALRPAQPLSADNVVPIFAAPTPPAPPAPPVPSPKGDGEVD